MATFSEKAAHLVNHMFPLLCLFVVLVVSHLGFEDENLVLIARVPGHCRPGGYHLAFTGRTVAQRQSVGPVERGWGLKPTSAVLSP